MVCLSSSGDTTMGLTASRTQASHCVFGILLLLDRIGLRYLERTSQYNISVSGRQWPHTTLRTDFLDDSCSSPAMINSSRIYAVNGLANVMQQRLGTFRTEYAFWKLNILARFNEHPSEITERVLTDRARIPTRPFSFEAVLC